jgi:NAD(P)-dependent dehydrogenase (short-subunit alcohol dehydrogenase family)
MSTETHAAAEVPDLFETANDRFKRSFSSWFWGSMVLATAFHFARLAFFPELHSSALQYPFADATKPVTAHTEAQWNKIWAVNVMAHVHAARALLPDCERCLFSRFSSI